MSKSGENTLGPCKSRIVSHNEERWSQSLGVSCCPGDLGHVLSPGPSSPPSCRPSSICQHAALSLFPLLTISSCSLPGCLLSVAVDIFVITGHHQAGSPMRIGCSLDYFHPPGREMVRALVTGQCLPKAPGKLELEKDRSNGTCCHQQFFPDPHEHPVPASPSLKSCLGPVD